MEIQYIYQKKRSEFGQQCRFSDTATVLIDDFRSDRKSIRNYIWRDPNSQGIGQSPIQAAHEINTKRALFHNTGLNHTEGGWPRDVNYLDEESTARYRRKIQKDDNYNPSVLALAKSMQEPILQNNAINIYERYFADLEILPNFEKTSARVVNVFKGTSSPPFPVNSLSWAPRDASKLAITYCNLTYNYNYKNIPEIDIFAIQNPNKPYLQFAPHSPATCTKYHQKDPNCLISGLINGQAAVWDVRKGKQPTGHSTLEVSHRAPVTGILWLATKSGMEFFTASVSGQVKFWDMRKLDRTIENLIVDFVKDEDQLVSNSMGVSALEYDTGTPTRFMLGTEHGYVVLCNRKGKTALEKMTAKYFAHYGPVLRVQRNAIFSKNFLTIGDWSVKIFAEECKESPLIWTSFHKCALTDGGWSPSRYSTYFTTRTDGIFDVWDILLNQQNPLIHIKLSDVPLTHMKIQQSGTYVAIGNSEGTTYMIELSENLLSSTKTEKTLLQALFERETKREKILEVRNRELRLKLRAKSAEILEGGKSQTDIQDTGANLQEVEDEYYELLQVEKAKYDKMYPKKLEDNIEA